MELAAKTEQDMTSSFENKLFENNGQRISRINAVAFDRAELKAGPTLGHGLYLVISGPAPKTGACIRLLPELSAAQPEYRRIEIIAEERAANDDCHLEIKQGIYEKSMPLSGIAGSKGIELVGSNGSKRFDLV